MGHSENKLEFFSVENVVEEIYDFIKPQVVKVPKIEGTC